MADEAGQEPTGQEPTIPETPTEPTEDKLTPEDLRKELAAARREAAKHRTDLRKTSTELETLRKSAMSDQEKAISEAKTEGRKEAEASVRLERVRDKVEAKSAGKLADPEDAPALLGDLSRFVNDDGTIDTKGISEAIDKLVKAKPYLAASRPSGSFDQGARPNTPAGADMNRLIRQAAGRT